MPFKKGQSGNPSGRPKKRDSPVPTSQEIRDTFYKAFIEIFAKGGGIKELVAFCKQNQLNKRLLIQEVRKILPEMIVEKHEVSPVIVVQRIITDDRKLAHPLEADIVELGKKGDVYAVNEKFLPEKETRRIIPEEATKPEDMSDDEIEERIKALEKRKADILAALAEKRPNKSKVVN